MQGKFLYLECKSGISGDMTVACLLDLGADAVYLNEALESLGLEGVRWEISKKDKNGIMASDFAVIIDGEHDPVSPSAHHHHHDHDHDDHHHHHDHHHHDHGGTHPHHDHDHGGHHHHDHHDHDHDDTHSHHHEHRNLSDISAIIESSGLTDRAKKLAIRIFTILAEAEAKVHGTTMDAVHFHEVGAIDSIIDIVAVAVCIDYLDIARVAISALFDGSGFVMSQHGRLPVPVPATLEIAAKYALPLNITDTPYELVTPTGIAIVAAIKTEDRLPQNIVISKIGYGAGKRDMKHANVLRGMLIEHASPAVVRTEPVWVLTSSIDDSTGEQLGYAMEVLLGAGALDVHYAPIFMKKNRPGWLLSVVTREDRINDLEAIIYRTTTTIGIRRQALERSFLEREVISIETPYGVVDVKKCFFGHEVFYYPEYESVKALANASGASFSMLMDEIKSLARSGSADSAQK